MRVELPALKRKVIETIEASATGLRVEDVSLEPDRDEDGSEYLRVELTMTPGGIFPDESMVALVEDIEAAIIAVDERYPSIRFLDAA